MKKMLTLFLLVSHTLLAQLPYKVVGSLPRFKKINIQVSGFRGCTPLQFASTTTDSMGNFSFTYSQSYVGAALVKVQGGPAFILLLNKENFSVAWDDVVNKKALQYTQSAENEALKTAIYLGQYAGQRLGGLRFLLPLYQNSLDKKKWLQDEITSQESLIDNFVNSLPSYSYAKQYIKLQKLLQEIEAVRQYPERLPQLQEEFKQINFQSDIVWQSGLLPPLFEGMYSLLENYGNSAEITIQSNAISDAWISNLSGNMERQQEVAEFCFKLLEKQNRSTEAEHIALSLLNQANCTLDSKRTSLFEQYRKLAIGNIAPDIALNNTSLKGLKAKYKLVVFGASWCPNCNTDYPSLVGKYKQFRDKFQTEVVYVSVDTDQNAYEAYYKEAPFIMQYDGKGWETQAVMDYHVFATPTYMLLDNDLKIIAKIKSPEHLLNWLENDLNN